MVLARHILIRRIALIAAIYFAIIGLYDIGMDIWHDKLSWSTFLFNLLFLVPLAFRQKAVHLFCGIVFTLLWGYILTVGIYLGSKHYVQVTTQQMLIGVAALFALICAIALLYRGLSLSEKP